MIEYKKATINEIDLLALTAEESTRLGCTKILLNATDMGRTIYEKFGFIDTENDMVYYIN